MSNAISAYVIVLVSKDNTKRQIIVITCLSNISSMGRICRLRLINCDFSQALVQSYVRLLLRNY